jgi:hypothetical protein
MKTYEVTIKLKVVDLRGGIGRKPTEMLEKVSGACGLLAERVVGSETTIAVLLGNVSVVDEDSLPRAA